MAREASGAATPTSKPAAAPTPLYSLSSQFRNWRYSKEDLEGIRSDLNTKAVERVRGMVEEERAQQTTAPTASTSASTSTTTSRSTSPAPAPPPPSEIQYLTVADELSLVTYYLTQIEALCRAFKFPEMVSATAMTYLKRFYLRNTCMDYHPKNVMLTSVFLATKTENHPISIDSFSSKMGPNTSPTDILSLEFLVSQSLRFEYKVHHAHLAARGLFLDMQTAHLAPEVVQTAYEKAQSLLRTSRLTDVEFIYAPSQIALAAFLLADPSAVETWLVMKEARHSAKGKEELGQDELRRCLEEIGEVVREMGRCPVDKGKVTEVDKRLRWARNPEKDPKSALFKKRKAEEEAEREERALSKAAKRPAVDDDDDVFE